MDAPILSIRDPDAIKQAVTALESGKLVIMPTDTIYGLAASPRLPESISRIYEVRARKPEPAIPFLMADSGYMETLARPTPATYRLAQRFWPGALTLILAPGSNLDPMLRASPIALRVPHYPDVIPLLEATGGYLMVTGAIRSGYPPAITAQEAADFFAEEVSLILDGGLSLFGIPSTIVDCIASPPQVIRRGVISKGKIRACLAPLHVK
ncbi:MAG: L-threonylcarbamoyladenylate synthase [Anaerolineales bacterium]